MDENLGIGTALAIIRCTGENLGYSEKLINRIHKKNLAKALPKEKRVI